MQPDCRPAHSSARSVMKPRLIRGDARKKEPRKLTDREVARKLKIDLKECAAMPHREGDLVDSQDPEQAGIFLAACRIVISGYRAEISREEDSSLYVRAAYELLRHFLQ